MRLDEISNFSQFSKMCLSLSDKMGPKNVGLQNCFLNKIKGPYMSFFGHTLYMKSSEAGLSRDNSGRILSL
jgi:hypothetical protein